MGIEKLWQKSRQDRLRDPSIQHDLDREWDRVRDSFGRLGDQTKDTCAGIVYNTVVRPFVGIPVGKKGKKTEFAPAKQILHGAADSTGKTIALVGRILLSSGRAAKYGVRKAFVI